ncbi:MAG: hypothetical protein V5804_03115 [Mucilaginibacter sp.]|uniref:hypothetical protein n=1 Tax=Mucilaginibacter sp. TaxID=1882438 RepID=UPI0034E43550
MGIKRASGFFGMLFLFAFNLQNFSINICKLDIKFYVMKKAVFFILFSGMVFTLKAQQNTYTPNRTPQSVAGLNRFSDTVPSNKLSKQQQNDLNLLFSPRIQPKKTFSTNHNLTALLDRMPIATPQGNWNMPIVKPDGTTKYTMPVLRGQPLVKPKTDTSKFTP